jgi:uracil-DNA glycosylase
MSASTSTSLDRLRRAAAGCTDCELYRDATQTEFGAGPSSAWLMLVGEQPGDQEDRQGEPFVGPAGRVLDTALERAGIDRSEVYVTNAVKHFRFEQDGKRRLHKTPTVGHVRACRQSLDGELAAVRPACWLPSAPRQPRRCSDPGSGSPPSAAGPGSGRATS